MKWIGRFQGDFKKYRWLKKLQSQGTEVKLLRDEPLLNINEQLVFTASGQCQTYTDVYLFCLVNGIDDKEMFISTVLSVKGEKSHA